MPTFEYHCRQCDREIEILVRSNEEPVCPTCNSKKLERLMSAPAGRASSNSFPVLGDSCPPPEAGPCHPNCCRLPQ
ncbi:FmdB family zinc ribbon protein [Thalassoglobus neptunius]|uniref:FmdB family zinc ribbon protein n=1 Tax=Thalassoglobus neptunius TaxID=1938619 RepID=UPI0011B7BCCC